MKKVLILSYFFPPCNLTASQRVLGWAKSLYLNGYYPIIVTRNWDIEIASQKDVSKSTGKLVVIKKYENYEVHYLPYKGNLKDRVYSKFPDRFVYFRRILSFIEQLFQNFTIAVIPYKNMYYYSKDIIKNNDIKKAIISATPFQLFYFGYKLQKATSIKWIADYRDDWNTDEIKTKKSFLEKFISLFEQKSEKKWISTASLITSVSNHYTSKISNFTKVNGAVIYNGFFLDEYYTFSEKSENNDVLTLTYNGTLYSSQNIEIFIEGFKKAVDQLKSQNIRIQLLFPGLNYDRIQAKRVSALLMGYEEYFKITNRIPRSEVIEIQRNSHILLMFPHSNLKGIPSSKLYEYLGLGKFILVCPTDMDIIEETINDTGNGLICNNSAEITNLLISFAKNKESFLAKIIREKNLKYTREEQTKVLAKKLDDL